MSLGHQRVEGAGRGHAVRKPEARAAAAIKIRGAAVAIAARTAVIAVDERHDLGEARLEDRDGGLDAVPGKTPLPGGDGDVARVEADDLAEALVVGDTVDDQPIDVRQGEAGIVERVLQRPDAEIVIVVFGQPAISRIANARDGVCATERVFRHRRCRAWRFSTVS